MLLRIPARYILGITGAISVIPKMYFVDSLFKPRFYQGLHIYCILVVSEMEFHCRFAVLDIIYFPAIFWYMCPVLVVFINSTCYRYRISRIYVAVGDRSYRLLLGI